MQQGYPRVPISRRMSTTIRPRQWLGEICFFLMAGGFFLFPETLCSQSGQAPAVVERSPQAAPESEITPEAMVSYGDWRILAGGHDCKLYTAGAEYARHSWGRMAWARFDYLGEVLPVVVLNEPAKADIWGNPRSHNRKISPGFGFSPIGFRLMWLDKKRVRPYFAMKGGLIAFPVKALSTEASYVNLSLQEAVGFQADLSPRWSLRVGVFSDFHFSDGFVVPVNPGLDVMNTNVGLTYHLSRKWITPRAERATEPRQ